MKDLSEHRRRVSKDILNFSNSVSKLDLHGVESTKHAYSIFLDFMYRAIEENISEVEIITGRGVHSKIPGKGVLVRLLPNWLRSNKFLPAKFDVVR
jgi:DNA-nicking Smr family endonuclease